MSADDKWSSPKDAKTKSERVSAVIECPERDANKGTLRVRTNAKHAGMRACSRNWKKGDPNMLLNQEASLIKKSVRVLGKTVGMPRAHSISGAMLFQLNSSSPTSSGFACAGQCQVCQSTGSTCKSILGARHGFPTNIFKLAEMKAEVLQRRPACLQRMSKGPYEIATCYKGHCFCAIEGKSLNRSSDKMDGLSKSSTA